MTEINIRVPSLFNIPLRTIQLLIVCDANGLQVEVYNCTLNAIMSSIEDITRDNKTAIFLSLHSEHKTSLRIH